MKHIEKIPEPTYKSTLDFTLSPEKIKELADKIIVESKTIHDSVAKTSPEACSFNTVIEKLAREAERVEE